MIERDVLPMKIVLEFLTCQRRQGTPPKPANRPVSNPQECEDLRGPLGRLLLYCGQNSFDRDRHCSCRLAFDGPRIADIELDNLAG